MPYQVDDALLHAMSGTELSRVRTELRLLPPEAYQQKSDRVEKGRHCYAIKSPTTHGGMCRDHRLPLASGFQCQLDVREALFHHPQMGRYQTLTHTHSTKSQKLLIPLLRRVRSRSEQLSPHRHTRGPKAGGKIKSPLSLQHGCLRLVRSIQRMSPHF
jgi:hypothetical protein